MRSYYCEFADIKNNLENREGIGKTTVRRGEYIETHAYPDEIAAEADPIDDNTFIDTDLCDFDV